MRRRQLIALVGGAAGLAIAPRLLVAWAEPSVKPRRLAYLALLPGENIGIIVLNNLPTAAPWILTLNLCDRLLGLDEVAWNERIKQEVDEAKEAIAARVSVSRADIVAAKSYFIGSRHRPDFNRVTQRRVGADTVRGAS